MSHVTCHMSHVIFFFFFFFGQIGEAYWWRVCYQRGLPRLVSQQGLNQQVSTYYHSFITIIQSHYSEKIPIASLQEEKMQDEVFLFVFNIEFPVFKKGRLKMV